MTIFTESSCLTVLGMLERKRWIFFPGRRFKACGTARCKIRPIIRPTCIALPLAVAKAVALVSFLENARLRGADICMLYLNPGQMINFINGLQWKEYEVIDASVVGESSCADTWGKALKTGKPCVSIPCFAERRYGGVLDDEMLICLSARDLLKGIEGAEALSKNGLRYPYAPYGIQNDCTEGMSISYK